MSSVRDNPAQHRYEIYDGDRLAGISEYKLTKNKIAFTHTEIDPAFGGRGLARELVTQELDDARRRDLAVLPFCPYVRKVIASNPRAVPRPRPGPRPRAVPAPRRRRRRRPRRPTPR